MKNILSKTIWYFLKIICLVLILINTVQNGFSQLLTTDNVNMSLQSGTQLTVQGDVRNQNGSTISNDGVIDLSGNWEHNAANNCFGTSAGTVIFNGGVQTIGGIGITAFNNLTLAGTGTKVLTQEIIAGGANASNSGVLNLGNRILDLNSHTLVISNPLTTAFTRLTGFVQSETDANAGYGIIKWNIGLAAAGSNFEFPFGNAATSSYIPFNFQVVSSGVLSNKGNLSIATYPTVTSALPNNRALPTGVSHLNNALNLDNSNQVLDRFWIMDVEGYSTNPVANLSMTYRSSEHDLSGGSTNVINESLLAAQRWDGFQWLAQTGNVDVNNNKVAVTGASSFNQVWTLVSSSSPLPIELLTFDAKLNKDKMVDLMWVTASEINNDYFTMERSADGINFENIGIVNGAGNSSSLLSYTGLDKTPYQGLSYYRLKQTDFDGKYSYSKVVPVELNNETKVVINMNIYPNPATENVNIQIQDESINPGSKLEIFNAIGQVVFSSTFTDLSSVANRVYRVNTSNLGSGIYMVRIMNGNEMKASQKLIKK